MKKGKEYYLKMYRQAVKNIEIESMLYRADDPRYDSFVYLEYREAHDDMLRIFSQYPGIFSERDIAIYGRQGTEAAKKFYARIA